MIRLTGVRGSGANISSEDEYRTSAQYDVRTILGEPTAPDGALELAGLRMIRSAGRSITIANGCRSIGGTYAGAGMTPRA